MTTAPRAEAGLQSCPDPRSILGHLSHRVHRQLRLLQSSLMLLGYAMDAAYWHGILVSSCGDRASLLGSRLFQFISEPGRDLAIGPTACSWRWAVALGLDPQPQTLFAGILVIPRLLLVVGFLQVALHYIHHLLELVSHGQHIREVTRFFLKSGAHNVTIRGYVYKMSLIMHITHTCTSKMNCKI